MGTNPSEFKDNPKNPVGKVSWYDAVMFCNKLSDIFGLDRYYTIFKDSKSIDTIEKKQDYVVGMNEDAKGFRLPTEWEWEYAAKAGTDLELEYSGSNNADDVGCYSGINKVGTHPIKQKKSNAWGFYDMSGDVREWCESRYDSTSEHRVIRGDDWESKQRVAYRWSADPSSLHFSFGFRIFLLVY
jgi:formylglycine-generating enzyme required for sulfatase activity